MESITQSMVCALTSSPNPVHSECDRLQFPSFPALLPRNGSPIHLSQNGTIIFIVKDFSCMELGKLHNDQRDPFD